ncbi:hypothetical protein C9374_004285 [Naegleria lovaniensis]|uniref:Uncharacterized protein n=1 Tax=Naegleria lovaniensis TaxID=51637 RepID=A0AA88KJ67_NAELO|nr:uncharacterized protein C9374_004285 [Naegleria lovaniensis]KAG2383614.1 hypothetical protein C9374_004285 [Naegleria lovaniensis]
MQRVTIFKVVISTLLITSLVFSSLCQGQFYGGFPYGTGGNPFGGYGGVINSLPYLPSSGSSFGYPGYGYSSGPYSSYGSGNNPYGYSSAGNPYTANYNSNGAGNNQQRLRFNGQIYGFNPFYHCANLVGVDLEYVGNCARLLSGAGSGASSTGGNQNFNPLFDPITGVNTNTLFGSGGNPFQQQQQSKQAGQDQQAKLELFAAYFANQTREHLSSLGSHAQYGPPGANDLVSGLVDAADRLYAAAVAKKWSDFSQVYQTLDNSLSRISYLALSQQVSSTPYSPIAQQQGAAGQQVGSGAPQQQFQIPQAPQPPQFQIPQLGTQQQGAQQQGAGPVNGAFNIPNIPNIPNLQQQPTTFSIPNIPNVPNPAQAFFAPQQQGAASQQQGSGQQGGSTQQQGSSQKQQGDGGGQQNGQQTQQQSQTQQTQTQQQELV